MSYKIMCLADLHLTEKKPPCRPDDEDWMATMRRKLDWMCDLAEEQNVDYIVVAGDVFDSVGKCSHEFMTFAAGALRKLGYRSTPEQILAIPGNHDLVNADHSRIQQSPFGVLQACGVLTDVMFPDCGVLPYGFTEYKGKARIVVGHYGLWFKEKPYPGAPDEGNVEWFVNSCLPKTCKLFITGHYHVPFVTKVRDTVVVNCGCPFRMRADLINYEPYVTIVTEDNDGVFHPKKFPIPLECEIRRDYLDNKKQQDAELDEMIGNIDGDFEVDFKFKDNFYNLSKNCENVKLINEEFERCVNGYYIK